MKKYLLLISLLFLTSCNLIKLITGKDGKLDENFASGKLSLEIYSPGYFEYRTFYLEDEDYVRTIYFEYPSNAKLVCSSDEGVTFVDCNGYEFQWDIINIDKIHVVRAIVGEQTIEKQFVPRDFSPNVKFLTCDVEITNNITITDFNAMAFNANDVVCLSDGVQIIGSEELNNFTDGMTLISRQNDVSTISSDLASSPIVNIMTSNVNIVGIEIKGNDTSNFQTGININGQNSITLEDVYIETNSNGANGLKFFNSSATLRNVTIIANDQNSSFGIYDYNSSLDIYFSSIISGNKPIYFWRDAASDVSLNFYHSNLTSNYVNPGQFQFAAIESYSSVAGNKNILNFNDSTLGTVNGALGFLIKSGAGDTEVVFNNSAIINYGINSASVPAIYFENDTPSDLVSFDNLSYVCTNDLTSTFSKIIELVNSSFSPNVENMKAHTNNTDIGICDYTTTP